MGARLGWGEIVVILIIALVVIGPEKLPDVGRALGQAVKGVKKYVREVTDELDAVEEVRELRKDLEDIRRDVTSLGKDMENAVTGESAAESAPARPAERNTAAAPEQEPAAENTAREDI